MQEPRIVSLNTLVSGAGGIVRQLQGGPEFTNRLAALGVPIGTEIKVLQNWGHGPVLVLARGTRIALGRHEARKVLVEELQGKTPSADNG